MCVWCCVVCSCVCMVNVYISYIYVPVRHYLIKNFLDIGEGEEGIGMM